MGREGAATSLRFAAGGFAHKEAAVAVKLVDSARIGRAVDPFVAARVGKPPHAKRLKDSHSLDIQKLQLSSK